MLDAGSGYGIESNRDQARSKRRFRLRGFTLVLRHKVCNDESVMRSRSYQVVRLGERL